MIRGRYHQPFRKLCQFRELISGTRMLLSKTRSWNFLLTVLNVQLKCDVMAFTISDNWWVSTNSLPSGPNCPRYVICQCQNLLVLRYTLRPSWKRSWRVPGLCNIQHSRHIIYMARLCWLVWPVHGDDWCSSQVVALIIFISAGIQSSS